MPLRRLAEANIEIHEYTANHPTRWRQWFVDNLNPVGLTELELTEIFVLGSLHNHPIGQALERADPRSPRDDLTLIKVLDPTTDPAELAARVTVDILA